MLSQRSRASALQTPSTHANATGNAHTNHIISVTSGSSQPAERKEPLTEQQKEQEKEKAKLVIEEVWLHFKVVDTGMGALCCCFSVVLCSKSLRIPGIPLAAQATTGHPFAQADMSTT